MYVGLPDGELWNNSGHPIINYQPLNKRKGKHRGVHHCKAHHLSIVCVRELRVGAPYPGDELCLGVRQVLHSPCTKFVVGHREEYKV